MNSPRTVENPWPEWTSGFASLFKEVQPVLGVVFFLLVSVLLLFRSRRGFENVKE